MSEVIVVTSGKGGVGKTTVAANLGCGLALLGNKVVLIDTDIGLRNLDVVMIVSWKGCRFPFVRSLQSDPLLLVVP